MKLRRPAWPGKALNINKELLQSGSVGLLKEPFNWNYKRGNDDQGQILLKFA
jgi:hypothetical protein